MLPTKGLTLPLLSYGGSSLIISGIMMAILFRVDVEIRRLQRRPKPAKESGEAKPTSEAVEPTL